MTEIPEARVEFDALACLSIVYRVASKSIWFNRSMEQLTYGAFIRYKGKDDDGLSVYLGTVDTCEKASKQLRKVYAVGSLHVGHIRNIQGANLDVIQDEPGHGYIAGLPFQNDDPRLSERLATQLQKLCRLCWSPDLSPK